MTEGSSDGPAAPERLPRSPGEGRDAFSPHEARLSFDRYTQLVCDMLTVPTALVSLIHEQAQTFPGATGLPEPWQSERWTPLIHSICLLAITGGSPVVIPDARLDPRTSASPSITDLDLIAYLGVPLLDGTQVVGAVCAIDTAPRTWTERDLHLLTGLTTVCSAELSLRSAHTRARAQQHSAENARDAARQDGQQACEAHQHSEHLSATSQQAQEHSRLLLALSDALTATTTVDSVIQVVQDTATTYLGTRSAQFDLAGSPYAPARASKIIAGPRFLALPLTGALRGRLDLTWPDRDSHNGSDDTKDAAAPDPVTSTVRETAVALAHYASTALDRAILLQERRSTAAVLQHAMLTTLPTRTDLDLAARYVPAATANQVGGDWYDAIALDDDPTGPLAIVIGDVAGHDIEAAALMGQIRSVLRGLLVDRPEPPAEMITRLDAALPRLAITTSSTLVLAVLHDHPDTPGVKRLAWTNAGHPLPLHISSDGRATLLPGPSDLLLGIPYTLPRHTRHIDLNPGDTLILYTDGVVERPGHRLSAGQNQLSRSSIQHYELPLQQTLDRILQDLIPRAPTDDCAILGVRIRRNAPSSSAP